MQVETFDDTIPLKQWCYNLSHSLLALSLPLQPSMLSTLSCPPPLLQSFSPNLPLCGTLPESTGVCGHAQMAVLLLMEEAAN